MKREERQPRDEALLIDFLLGKCDAAQAEEVARRLETDEAFARLHDDFDRTFSALGKLPAPAAPADLTDRALASIRANRQQEVHLSPDPSGPARRWLPTFSLKEMAAVAAAVVLLAAIAVPAWRTAKQKQMQRQCGFQIGQIGAALKRYALDNDGILPGVEGVPRRWLPSGAEPVVSTSAGLFKLVKARWVPASVFVCPASTARPSRYVIEPTMTDFPSHRAISYSYQYTLGGRQLSIYSPRLVDVADEMAILSDRTPVFSEGHFQPDRVGASSDNHRGNGQNVLYLDGRVDWQRTPDAGVSGDNIFLINGVEDYRGDEVPTEETDSFLLPAYSKVTP